MEDFDVAYEGTPPWDIGRPQHAVQELHADGWFRGKILDVGCGTGENALYLAKRGFSVTGIDASGRAIEKAQGKAANRGVEVQFRVEDALHIPWRAHFDRILDSGLFHIFNDEERIRYAEQLRDALVPGGRLVILCFSDKEPTDWGGPRRIAKHELEDTLHDWEDVQIEATRFATNLPDVYGHALLATARRP